MFHGHWETHPTLLLYRHFFNKKINTVKILDELKGEERALRLTRGAQSRIPCADRVLKAQSLDIIYHANLG